MLKLEIQKTWNLCETRNEVANQYKNPKQLIKKIIHIFNENERKNHFPRKFK